MTKPKTTITATTMTTTTGASTSARLGLMLTDLRLPTIKRLAGDLCAQSDLEGWPAHRFLEALLEHEINERERRRIDRHRHDSGLGPDKRLSSFDFAAVPNVSKAQVLALSEGTEWLDRGANVLLFGPPGVGKSHLVSAFARCQLHRGRDLAIGERNVGGTYSSPFGAIALGAVTHFVFNDPPSAAQLP